MSQLKYTVIMNDKLVGYENWIQLMNIVIVYFVNLFQLTDEKLMDKSLLITANKINPTVPGMRVQ